MAFASWRRHRAIYHWPVKLLMAPSCVPATDLSTAGASLNTEQLAQLLNDGIVHGLAEMMNYPGVISGDDGVLSKIAEFRGRPVDGHAPGVGSKALNAYIAAGIGSDHECMTVDEAREKLARGLYYPDPRSDQRAQSRHPAAVDHSEEQPAHLLLHR